MSIIITTSWDDGNKCDMRVSKLLEKYKLKGTFYIPIKYSQCTLEKRDILKLSKQFEIGSHGLNHRRLNFLSKNEKMEEILKSKKILENIINKKIKSFAYPFGVYDKKSLEYVRTAGYVFARTHKEFYFEFPNNPLVSNVSLELSHKISRILSIKGISYIMKGYSWLEIAKVLFNKISDKTIFHVFGHSWKIEKNNEWDMLEELFDYITNRKNFISLKNFELVD